MLSLKEFKAVKIENKNLAQLQGGTEYTRSAETGSTVDTIKDGEFCDASGCVPMG